MKSIFIVINGEEQKTMASSLQELLKELVLPLSTVLVEHNGVALHRHEIETVTLSEGDKIEILKVVAGG